MIRIVKMRFKEEETDAFLNFFNGVHQQIRNFPGCTHLQLWQDAKDPQTFFTYSHWNDEAALETYRQSELFQSFWKVAKSKFAEKAQAWSVNSLVTAP